ncbi:MAG: hypothetical protein ABI281_01300 [Caldimonas sp.]
MTSAFTRRCAAAGCVFFAAALAAGCSPDGVERSRAAEREANGVGQPVTSLGDSGAEAEGAIQLAALFRRCREAARSRLGKVTRFDDGVEPERAAYYLMPSAGAIPIVAIDRSVPYSALAVPGPVRGVVFVRGMVDHRPAGSSADDNRVYFCRVEVDGMTFDVQAVSIEIVR